MGIPPTGRRVAIEVIDIVRVVDGRVVEHWNVADNLGLLQQRGVLPSLGHAAGQP
jgi:predicted ester cyclase